ncbi:MAG: sugar phosphate isomerase/epimerase [Oscillospiraceae bacterium]|nr:sugar phosphate isomerase/epimerase [Oscillospiraceae bacterium]
MYIGISTGCFYPQFTDISLKNVVDTGVKYTEIFFNTDSELEEEYLLKLKQIADEKGVQIISVHPFTSAIETFMFFSRTDYKLADSIKYYEKYFRACQILGAKYVVIHGCNTTAEYISMEKYAEIMNLLSAKASEYGVYVSQENVVRFKCGYIENLIKLKKYSNENIKFVLDVKQAARAGQDIWQLLDLMGDRISHLHISDQDHSEDSMLPGEGNFDFRKLFRIAEGKYGVKHALIEVYSKNLNNMNQLNTSLDFLHKLDV